MIVSQAVSQLRYCFQARLLLCSFGCLQAVSINNQIFQLNLGVFILTYQVFDVQNSKNPVLKSLYFMWNFNPRMLQYPPKWRKRGCVSSAGLGHSLNWDRTECYHVTELESILPLNWDTASVCDLYNVLVKPSSLVFAVPHPPCLFWYLLQIWFHLSASKPLIRRFMSTVSL